MAMRLSTIYLSSFLCLLMMLSGAACGGSGPSNPSAPPATTTTTSVAATTTTSAPTPPTTTTVPPRRIRRRATFRNANGYLTEGTAQIVNDDGEFTLELDSDFRTSQSQALDVRLCSNTNCQGDSMNLGDLQRFSGRQSYSMPNDGDAFTHVVIFCYGVNLAFGDGILR